MSKSDLKPIIDVIIPANNEENAIPKVINELPKHLLRNIIVVNNASTDQTRASAVKAGAIVIDEPTMGYGKACLKGMDYVSSVRPLPSIIVFLDGDHSDYPEELPLLIKPVLEDDADLVIGSRALGNREKGSMTFPQRFGNALATFLLRLFYGVRFTDLGPFRAIRYSSLLQLGMEDQNYGWTVEMQLKAAKMGMSCTEIAVNYRKRIGTSKVSGTIKGSFMAGYKILLTIFKYL